MRQAASGAVAFTAMPGWSCPTAFGRSGLVCGVYTSVMNELPTPETNILYNEAATDILTRACKDLTALGLHCSFGAAVLLGDNPMGASLHVSTSAGTVEELIVGGLVVSDYVQGAEGRGYFNLALKNFRANQAILDAMESKTIQQ